MIGVSDSPLTPAANLYCEYLIDTSRTFLIPPIFIDAMHNLPDNSLSATLKNLALFDFIFEINSPLLVTSFNLFSIYSLLILTLLKESLPLSTPFIPILCPMSSMNISLQGFIYESRIWTTKLFMPSFCPLTIVCANTIA